MVYRSIALIFLISISAACSKKDKHAEMVTSPSVIYSLAKEHKIEESKNSFDGINAKEYSIGVNPYTSKVYKFKDLVFYAIEFPNEESAMNEAKRLGEYYSKNWLFDRVNDEPVLEELVVKVFGAKKAY